MTEKQYDRGKDLLVGLIIFGLLCTLCVYFYEVRYNQGYEDAINDNAGCVVNYIDNTEELWMFKDELNECWRDLEETNDRYWGCLVELDTCSEIVMKHPEIVNINFNESDHV